MSLTVQPIIDEQPCCGLNDQQLLADLHRLIDGQNWQRVLLLPPDFTRANSGAGKLVNMLYNLLAPTCQVDIMPALGTHAPMTPQELTAFFGDIPQERFLVHRWRDGVTCLGQVPAAFVHQVSEGLMQEDIPVEVGNPLVNGGYDIILSIGQVVPHEVVGMANYTKNIVVGCGGSQFISRSHMLGAFYGLERIMGRDHSPVRQVFDYAEQHFLCQLPLVYLLTVTTTVGEQTHINGLYIGRERSVFERAVALSQQLNITRVEKPIQHAVVYLDGREFHSTWLGNKAVYRTRMAMAEGGLLTVLAPGVQRFGEDLENDRLIRKYGYVGRQRVLQLVEESQELRDNLSVAAHLIHGSSDGRFEVCYATRHLSRQEVLSVGYRHAPLEDMLQRYNPAALHDGWNTLADGEEIYYISNPALGLWMLQQAAE